MFKEGLKRLQRIETDVFSSAPVFIGPMGRVVTKKVSQLTNLTDVTLADQTTNSLQTDNANMTIQGNVAMQVTQPGGQLWNQCM